ncbi:hypothetical protein EII17_07140 [Clostridiales bacterium COT073_COT-073]|nr:hypothetical protein EII17_07140 [Clostridiales bacterium COT073_COT-073]
MRKAVITYKSISPVILTSRIESALYKGIDFSRVASNDKIQIIYPFYSHDSRNLQEKSNFHKANSYYIPASSLKGALLGKLQYSDIKKVEKKTSKKETEKLEQEEISFRSQMRFRDVEIEPENIQLHNLEKAQYLYREGTIDDGNKKITEKKYNAPIWEAFFPAIQVEMLKANVEFQGEIAFRAEENEFIETLNRNFKTTERKIANYIAEIENRLKKIEEWALADKKIVGELSDIKKKLQGFQGKENLIFLGGYKGILAGLTNLTILKKEQREEVRNGFYVDKDSRLPYGLVEVNYTIEEV